MIIMERPAEFRHTIWSEEQTEKDLKDIIHNNDINAALLYEFIMKLVEKYNYKEIPASCATGNQEYSDDVTTCTNQLYYNIIECVRKYKNYYYNAHGVAVGNRYVYLLFKFLYLYYPDLVKNEKYIDNLNRDDITSIDLEDMELCDKHGKFRYCICQYSNIPFIYHKISSMDELLDLNNAMLLYLELSNANMDIDSLEIYLNLLDEYVYTDGMAEKIMHGINTMYDLRIKMMDDIDIKNIVLLNEPFIRVVLYSLHHNFFRRNETKFKDSYYCDYMRRLFSDTLQRHDYDKSNEDYYYEWIKKYDKFMEDMLENIEKQPILITEKNEPYLAIDLKLSESEMTKIRRTGFYLFLKNYDYPIEPYPLFYRMELIKEYFFKNYRGILYHILSTIFENEDKYQVSDKDRDTLYSLVKDKDGESIVMPARNDKEIDTLVLDYKTVETIYKCICDTFKLK